MSAPTPPAPGGPHPSGTRTTPVMVACMLSAFVAILDLQIVSTALPRIAGDLGGIDLFAWVTIAYVIASSVTTPIYGKLGDLFGRKVTYLSAMGLFLLGSALAAPPAAWSSSSSSASCRGWAPEGCSSPSSRSSASCSPRARAPSTTACSAWSSPAPPWPARPWAVCSPTRSAGTGSFWSTSPSAP
ncbi:MFS transporter [Streptomyces globisporus]|uniref:MFS transporter n=1 Tax=Streptomyces globisporus TaxID=1908 RepID=A0A927GLZ8_STRGL|nr:MFS transporter [Streptomyces globisporus]